jgi:GNAT superfamily N-acetyltransferase
VSVLVDRAVAGDERAILEMSVWLMSEQRQADAVREAHEAGTCFVAREENRVVGFITWQPVFFGRPFVPLVVVAASHRRRGVAGALIQAVERDVKGGELFVSTETINLPMRALLAGRGYAPSGSVDNINAPGNAELIFYKRLP